MLGRGEYSLSCRALVSLESPSGPFSTALKIHGLSNTKSTALRFALSTLRKPLDVRTAWALAEIMPLSLGRKISRSRFGAIHG